MKTITIEARFSLEEPEKEEVMKKVCREAARHILSTAMLLADHRGRPQVAMHSKDFFEGEVEMSIMDDEDDLPKEVT